MFNLIYCIELRIRRIGRNIRIIHRILRYKFFRYFIFFQLYFFLFRHDLRVVESIWVRINIHALSSVIYTSLFNHRGELNDIKKQSSLSIDLSCNWSFAANKRFQVLPVRNSFSFFTFLFKVILVVIFLNCYERLMKIIRFLLLCSMDYFAIELVLWSH